MVEQIPHELEIEEPEEGVLRLAGELDLNSQEALVEAMDRVIGRQEPGDVVLDLRSLSFMDSSGVKVIIEAAQRLGPRRSIVLRHPAGEVRRLIDVTGLERLPSISVETS